ncbi:MAG: hypothetical protein ABTQ32_14445 [Myxococcaceae bacterium]
MKQLHATATCSACGEVIVFQGDAGVISCGECGWVATQTWQSMFVELDLGPRVSRSDGNVMRLAPVRVVLTLETAEALNCPSCGTMTTPTGDWFADGARCGSCAQPFAFTTFEGQRETGQVVMTTVPPHGPRVALSTFSITCAKCGAPLTTDGTHKTVSCQFCHAANVVPVTARANRPIESVFVGLFSDVTEYPHDWVFEDSPVDALNALQAWRRRTLPRAQVAHLLVKHKHHLGLFTELTTHHDRSPALDTARALADSTEPAIAKWAKERLLEDADAQRRANEALADEKRRARHRALAPVVVVLLLVIVVALLVHFSAGSADP